MKINKPLTLADSICDTRVKKVKQVFFTQINQLIDWQQISTVIDKYYTKGTSATGKPSYDGLLLFKICLLQTWYGLSDYEVEDRINDSLSFSSFLELTIDQTSPDHSTISRFRTAMTGAGAYDELLKSINKQLEQHQILVKTGAIVDASIVETPLKPKGKSNYELEAQQQQQEQSQEVPTKTVEKKYSTSVDIEAAWIKRGKQLKYGYKKHYVTDNEGLVLGVLTTKASVNEISNLETVLKTADLPKDIAVKADKGYQSEKNNELLKTLGLKNNILKKATKNKALTQAQTNYNKLISKTRYKIERTFGSIKRWFNGGIARYRGIAKMHTQNIMEAIAYNLYRSPGILMSKA